ncbi:MAG: carboxylating nicotinate-nucleotide diphosphorylase [Campylobacteraceae bacterium]|nr:carboxylating nicotinate-nucleotide diphosphorylase [Campylobacteraceae bacterium]
MIKKFVVKALNEDLGRGDLFEIISYPKEATAKIISKDSGVFAGEIYAKELCKYLNCEIDLLTQDGKSIKNGDTLAKLKGDTNSLLKLERTLLNLLQHASGIATNTQKYVKKIENLNVVLLDTRKTRPLLRNFEKYAVRCGGAHNHRFGLDDALMLKDTHLAILKDLKSSVQKARKLLPFTTKIEVECENLDQAKEAFLAGVDIIMCDNMSLSEIKKVVKLKDEKYPHVKLEASGGISLENIEIIAKSGVDAISVGSLIHQAKWLDFSMKMEPFNGR